MDSQLIADLNAESIKRLCMEQFETRINLLEKKLALQEKLNGFIEAIMDRQQATLGETAIALVKTHELLEKAEKTLASAIQKLEDREDGGDWWKNG